MKPSILLFMFMLSAYSYAQVEGAVIDAVIPEEFGIREFKEGDLYGLKDTAEKKLSYPQSTVASSWSPKDGISLSKANTKAYTTPGSGRWSYKRPWKAPLLPR